jgi:hypothetical protein
MISNLNDSFLRSLLRVYFLFAFLVIGLAGSQVCKCFNKLKVMKGRQVSLVEMTGWLKFSEIMISVWKLRRFPGGLLLGLLMLTASVLALVSDLATSALVSRQYLPSRCAFTNGLVINTGVDSYISPPPNEAGARLASNAQITR